jgi:outer membrane putative beta-barrel porin/alpha-amylase
LKLRIIITATCATTLFSVIDFAHATSAENNGYAGGNLNAITKELLAVDYPVAGRVAKNDEGQPIGTGEKPGAVKRKKARKANVTLDLSLGYSQLKDVASTEFKTLTSDIVATYRGFDKLDLFLGLPLVYGERKDAGNFTHSNAGIGDVYFGLYYQLLDEDDWFVSVRPLFLVKSNSGSSPYKATGSEVVSGDGHWSVEAGSEFSKTIGQLMLFSQVSYTYYFDARINGQKNQHGDVFYYHIGSAYQLRKDLDVSLRLENTFVGDSKIEGVESEDSRAPINLTSSIEYDLSPKVSLTPALTFRVSSPAKDFSVSLTYGYKF